MHRNIVAIERDGLSVRVLTLTFDVPNEQFDLVAAVKDAARAFCQTEEGRKMYIYNCGCFNWADFEYVPNEICQQFGFQRLDTALSDIEANWDEQLVDIPDGILKDIDGEDDGFNSP